MMEDNRASKSITIQLSKYVKSVPTVSDNPRMLQQACLNAANAIQDLQKTCVLTHDDFPRNKHAE